MPIDERREWQGHIRASRQSRPDAWPPPVVEGAGSSFGPPTPNFKRSNALDRVVKLFKGVWGVIMVIVAAFAGGAAAVKYMNDYPKKSDLKEIADTLAEVRKAQENDQRANEVTFASIKNDIQWLKRMNTGQSEDPIIKSTKKTK
jgi:hypothetical protein